MVNFNFSRNPKRVQNLLSVHKVVDKITEQEFLAKLKICEPALLQPLVVIIGGFMDQFLANSYHIIGEYGYMFNKCDLYFREHYEAKQIRALVELYAKAGHKIAVIGHSWGGDCGVNLVTKKLEVPVDLLISLDPVSRKGQPHCKISQAKFWINIHVNYKQSKFFNIGNLIGRIGGAWQKAEQADINIACSAHVNHAQAPAMLEYAIHTKVFKDFIA